MTREVLRSHSRAVRGASLHARRASRNPVCGTFYDHRMTSIEQLIRSIDTRLDQLAGEIAKLEDAQKALADGKAPSTSTPASVPRRTQRKPRAKPKRSTEVLLAGQVEQMLRESSDGLRTPDIAERGNADPGQVLTLLRELEKTCQVRRTGERRGTRWHLITDEDRIAERAAELASRSRSV